MRITSKVLVMDMLAVYWGLCGGLVRGENELAMCSLEPPVMLPDGTEFQTWEQPLRFERTYHVDGSNPNASDANPGTSDRPFATINRAAQVLQPGERVVVAAGVYREWARPERGGHDREH
ncbi:DUF1565 domain-containing protein [bacterium]|nr:DUF1565 domain-containing protein [bacterium]